MTSQQKAAELLYGARRAKERSKKVPCELYEIGVHFGDLRAALGDSHELVEGARQELAEQGREPVEERVLRKIRDERTGRVMQVPVHRSTIVMVNRLKLIAALEKALGERGGSAEKAEKRRPA